MADSNIVLASLRGGMNNTDAASSLQDDQCELAENVEFFFSMLGERRQGCEPIDLTGSSLDDEDVIAHLSEWYPDNNVNTPELWAIGATANTSASIAKRTSAGTWSVITPDDALNTSEPDIYEIMSVALNGKKFFAYHSAQDRLHVWDGTYLRRTGLAAPAAPTGANNGSGSFSGIRYYRVRYVEMSGSTVKRRSEPGATLTFTPSGTGSGVTVTKPAGISEHETHWELEASTDNAFWYRIARTAVGTTTYTDTTAFATGYAAGGVLSEAVGAYLLQASAKYLVVDSDRLVTGSHWTDATMMSNLSWSAVSNDPGVGNDERQPIVTTGGENIDTTIRLDNYEGGPITGLSEPDNGQFYAFKWARVHKIARTQDVTKAYDSITVSSSNGAIPGSVVNGLDENSRGCVYFLDPVFGPTRLGPSGLQVCRGLRATWRRVNTFADQVIARGVYYPDKHQVHWWVSVDGADAPNFKIVLQTTEQRPEGEGVVRGFSVATGKIATAFSVCVLHELVTNDPAPVTAMRARPFAGLPFPDLIQRCDTGGDDAGTTYRAIIRTKPYFPAGLLSKWGAMVGALLATTGAEPMLQIKLIGDYGANEKQILRDLTGEQETTVKLLDDLALSDVNAMQIEFSDPEW